MLTEAMNLTLDIFQNDDDAHRIQFHLFDGELSISLIDDENDGTVIGKGYLENDAQIKTLIDFLKLCCPES